MALSPFAVLLLIRTRTSPINRLAELSLVLVPFVTACLAAKKLRDHRQADRPLRHLTLAIAVASLLGAVQAAVWLAYTLAGTELPYPSAADALLIAADITWVAGIAMLYWALDTSVREELTPFLGVLMGTWALTISIFALIGINLHSAGSVVQLALDLFYPMISALSCGLLGSLVLGPQLRRIAPEWRWFVGLLYLLWFFWLLTSLAFAAGTAKLSGTSASFEVLYFNGGPIDLLYIFGCLIACWAVAFIPLQVSLTPSQEGGPSDHRPPLP